MVEHVIAPRYAKVLFDMDCINGNFEKRQQDFELIGNIFEHNPKFARYLKAPLESLEEKKKILQETLKDKFDQKFINFLDYLIQKDRLNYLNSIRNEYKVLVDEYLENWEADIVTATTLDEKNEIKLLDKLEKIFQKKIKLNKKIDPKIIGGAILIVSNQMLDWSIAGRLKRLKEKLLTTKNQVLGG